MSTSVPELPWYQFSPQSLLLLTLFVAVLGSIGVRTRKGDGQGVELCTLFNYCPFLRSRSYIPSEGPAAGKTGGARGPMRGARAVP